jgi:hypothetical protein
LSACRFTPQLLLKNVLKAFHTENIASITHHYDFAMSSDHISIVPSPSDIAMTTLEQSLAAQPDLATELYKNSPVSSSCIRILEVHARENSSADDAPLRCSLRVTDLNSAPPPSYTALSYVWGGDTSLPNNIYCDNTLISVTNSCYQALQHLRAIKGSLKIWIDAVCINQKDQDEKTHQISLMGDIYSKAETTYIWLGEGSAIMDRVMGFLGRVGFLEHFYKDRDTRDRVRKRPQTWRFLLSYWKGRWGYARSTVPHRAQCELFQLFGLVNISDYPWLSEMVSLRQVLRKAQRE